MSRQSKIDKDVERLKQRWGAFDPAVRAAPGVRRKAQENERLTETPAFGANPGALRMLSYAPGDLRPGAPLVVVLHGCTQTAADYDERTGWSRLADERGFAVLYPEQVGANNPSRCFNWFQTADAARGLGETRSIREMVDVMIARHGLDAARVYVTGLSAGGAMAAALLADYPETFAGGAVIAGLPCGAATSVQEAFEAMRRPNERSAEELGDIVRASSAHEGPWPMISIWHGGADATVVPRNADELVKQWTDVHGLKARGFREQTVDGVTRRIWSRDGRDLVELNLVTGMGHGVPIDHRRGESRGPFMFDVGVSSTGRIAAFWGLGEPARDGAAEAPRARTATATPRARASEGARTGFAGRIERDPKTARPGRGGVDVGAVISRALRAAGLMK